MLRSLLHANATADLMSTALSFLVLLCGMVEGANNSLLLCASGGVRATDATFAWHQQPDDWADRPAAGGTAPMTGRGQAQEGDSCSSSSSSAQMTSAIKLARLLARKMEMRGGAASVTTPPAAAAAAADAAANAQLLACATLTVGEPLLPVARALLATVAPCEAQRVVSRSGAQAARGACQEEGMPQLCQAWGLPGGRHHSASHRRCNALQPSLEPARLPPGRRVMLGIGVAALGRADSRHASSDKPCGGICISHLVAIVPRSRPVAPIVAHVFRLLDRAVRPSLLLAGPPRVSCTSSFLSMLACWRLHAELLSSLVRCPAVPESCAASQPYPPAAWQELVSR